MEIILELTQELEDIKENKIPGAVVLVGNEDEIIFEKAYGIKNPETNEKYNTDDIFRIASMTKAITSVGVLKLWEEGKIGLDDPIDKYIPKFENIEILESFNNEDTSYTSKISTKKITIRQLLTHTSGIRDFYLSREENIYNTLNAYQDNFDEKEFNRLNTYIRSFFDIMRSDTEFKAKILSKCRG